MKSLKQRDSDTSACLIVSRIGRDSSGEIHSRIRATRKARRAGCNSPDRQVGVGKFETTEEVRRTEMIRSALRASLILFDG